MTKTTKNSQVTIVGYVDTIDEDDQEAGIIISTDDNEEYLVDLNKQGRKLLDLIGEEVKVHGAVTQTEGGENRISVTKFEVLDYKETSLEHLFLHFYGQEEIRNVEADSREVET